MNHGTRPKLNFPIRMLSSYHVLSFFCENSRILWGVRKGFCYTSELAMTVIFPNYCLVFPIQEVYAFLTWNSAQPSSSLILWNLCRTPFCRGLLASELICSKLWWNSSQCHNNSNHRFTIILLPFLQHILAQKMNTLFFQNVSVVFDNLPKTRISQIKLFWKPFRCAKAY